MTRTDIAAPLTPLREKLAEAIGASNVLHGSDLEGLRFGDWSSEDWAVPGLVLVPRTPEHVAAALRLCNEAGQPVVVQGGLTGLAGGANPLPGEVVLSLSRLNAIEEWDLIGGTVVVQAGVTLEQLQIEAAKTGWSFPLDLGARGSCQLGGNAATNAGGNLVLRHGMMRQSILGLEAALPDGRLLTLLDRVIKNNAGFDLKHLFIGTEGTLGVITRLALKLQPLSRARCTTLCAVNSFEDATLLLRAARESLPDLSVFEIMWDDFMDAGAQVLRRELPFHQRYPLYVLIEVQGHDGDGLTSALESFLSRTIEDGLVADAILAQSLQQASQLWEWRESVSELLSVTAPCAAFDVSVALPDMAPLVQALKADLGARYPGRQHLFFGHLGDGNLHLISGAYHDPGELLEVERLVYARVGAAQGSVSAEHGIGRHKRPYLTCSRSESQIELMRDLKRLFDPNAILNRARVI